MGRTPVEGRSCEMNSTLPFPDMIRTPTAEEQVSRVPQVDILIRAAVDSGAGKTERAASLAALLQCAMTVA